MSNNTTPDSNDDDLDLLDGLSTDEIALLEAIFKNDDDFDLGMLDDFVDADTDEDFFLDVIFSFMSLASSIDRSMRSLNKFRALLNGAMAICTEYTVELDEAVTYLNDYVSQVRDSVAFLNKVLFAFNEDDAVKEYSSWLNYCTGVINRRMGEFNEGVVDINERLFILNRCRDF